MVHVNLLDTLELVSLFILVTVASIDGRRLCNSFIVALSSAAETINHYGSDIVAIINTFVSLH